MQPTCDAWRVDDKLLWAFGAGWAGIAWAIVTWCVAEARGDKAGMKKFGGALVACLALSAVLVVLMMFAPGTQDGQDLAAMSGMVTGATAGVFTAFGVMGGSPPDAPPE